MPNTHLPPYWGPHLVSSFGGHYDTEKDRFLKAWSQAEGGTAKWNPLNTTFRLPGSENYNSAGVQNYPAPTWGVYATGLTLTEHDDAGHLVYPKLLGHLQSSAGTYAAEQIVNDCADEIRKWGTDPALILRVLAS